jgi:hypothetical protein
MLVTYLSQLLLRLVVTEGCSKHPTVVGKIESTSTGDLHPRRPGQLLLWSNFHRKYLKPGQHPRVKFPQELVLLVAPSKVDLLKTVLNLAFLLVDSRHVGDRHLE